MAKRFTFEHMKFFATEAWGALGGKVCDKWAEYNEQYFHGQLKPIPLVLTNAQPFGSRLAFCSYDPGMQGRTITLNVPKNHDELLADNGVLLHEMIHQYLFERGENPKHASEAWRREIMRLHADLTGKTIWAGRSKTARDPKDMTRVIRINEPTANGKKSLKQGEIARWPHSCNVKLGKLGLLHVLQRRLEKP